MRKTAIVVVLLVLVLVMVGPAGATPPETLEITSASNYTFADFYNPTGTWHSEGLIETDGELEAVLSHFGAGWPPGKGFQTAHIVEVYGDAHGSITIQSHTTGVEWTYDGPYLQHFEGSGQWVILSGTGAYEDLHGQGTISIVGDADFGAGTMVVEATYSGQAHFDPQP